MILNTFGEAYFFNWS